MSHDQVWCRAKRRAGEEALNAPDELFIHEDAEILVGEAHDQVD